MLKTILMISAAVLGLALAAALFFRCWPAFGRLPSESRRRGYAERTKYYERGRFRNSGSFVLIDRTAAKEKTAGPRRPAGKIPVIKRKGLPPAGAGELAVTWFGHSTILLELGGKTFLTDPVLSQYSSPARSIGPKRLAEPPMTARQLPEIDLVLLSHDHFDHLDYRTIRAIDQKVKAYCVPLGVECRLEGWGVDPAKIRPMAWGDEVELDGVRITFMEGQHFSGRSLIDQNRTWWGGYLLRDGRHKVYFTGDTGYGAFFKRVAEKFGGLDLILTDTGQYSPRWPNSHMNPEQALQAAEDTGAAWMIPVHWAGFVLSDHGWSEPAERIYALSQGSPVKAAVPRIGETLYFSRISEYRNPWWREVR